jgi:hypothetical protein
LLADRRLLWWSDAGRHAFGKRLLVAMTGRLLWISARARGQNVIHVVLSPFIECPGVIYDDLARPAM